MVAATTLTTTVRTARRRRAQADVRRARIVNSLTGRDVGNMLPAQPIFTSSRRKRSKPLNGVSLDDAHPHLWLTEDNLDLRFRDVLQCVLDRNSMQEISIYNILTTFTRRDIQCLYDAIARMPKLQKFNLWASSSMTVPALTSFLQQAPGLTAVGFSNVKISSLEDLTLLSKHIHDHPSLTKLTLDNLVITTPGLTLDILLQAVADNPRIECLRISTAHGAGSNMISQPSSLLGLCQNLKELRLGGIELSDSHVQKMTQALAHSPAKLTTLILRKCGPHLTDKKGYQAMIDMLQHNTRLEELHLDPLVAADDDADDDDDDADSSNSQHSLQWKIDFYLHWNKSGVRQTLFQNPNATRASWLGALSAHGQDLNALCYLLHESGPALFTN